LTEELTAGDDLQLITDAARGDNVAFDRLVIRHGPFALRVARRILRDHALAEEVVQEAFVRAWQHAASYQPRRGLVTTWLYRIVFNLCMDRARSIRLSPIPEGYDAVDPATSADMGLEAREQSRMVSNALGELVPRQRAAITLVYYEELPASEAGRILGVTPKAVERLLARARAQLRKRLCSISSMKEYLR
jgi:RNA polymerase sigma-70 factor, ECF subfamily